MFDFLAPFIIGFVGSLHCLGMCGPLVMAYSLHLRSANGGPLSFSVMCSAGFAHHLAFHTGRLCTYGFLGALAAGLAHLAGLHWLMGLRGGISFAGGVLMVLSGLLLLKVLPFPLFSSPPPTARFLGRVFPLLLESRGLASKWALGLATGFLPCMLSWAMVVKAATTQHPLPGLLTMVSFGAGTFPALFFVGLFASLLSLRTRILGERLAACAVIAMGLILIFKGARYFA